MGVSDICCSIFAKQKKPQYAKPKPKLCSLTSFHRKDIYIKLLIFNKKLIYFHDENTIRKSFC